jgi:hypothetical protein
MLLKKGCPQLLILTRGSSSPLEEIRMMTLRVIQALTMMIAVMRVTTALSKAISKKMRVSSVVCRNSKTISNAKKTLKKLRRSV